MWNVDYYLWKDLGKKTTKKQQNIFHKFVFNEHITKEKERAGDQGNGGRKSHSQGKEYREIKVEEWEKSWVWSTQCYPVLPSIFGGKMSKKYIL